MSDMKRLAMSLAVLLALTGCSGTSASTPSPSAATETPSPSESVVSVSQWASAVAPLKAEWQETQESWEDATCSALAANDGAVDCAAMLTTMQIQAATINLGVSAMANPEAKTGYLGTPPSEIATAYQALADAAKAADTWESSPVDCPGNDCLPNAIEFERAWKDLGSAFAAWEPWL